MSTHPLDRVRRICMALPEAYEKLSHGEPTFGVKKKLFAMYADAGNHHGNGRHALWCNAPEGLQNLLVTTEPEKYFVPPYVGVRGWIGINLDAVDDDELEAQVAQSYCMVAPKKLVEMVGG